MTGFAGKRDSWIHYADFENKQSKPKQNTGKPHRVVKEEITFTELALTALRRLIYENRNPQQKFPLVQLRQESEL